MADSRMPTNMRIGIYGGSFDPIHLGHLLVAESCREQLELDEVRFVLANHSPLKLDRQPTEDKHRIAMIELAIGGQAAFKLDFCEIERGGISYTVDTLRNMKQAWPNTELFFIMGADSLADLNRWKEPAEICKLAYPVVVSRGGEPEPKWEILDQYMENERLEATKQVLVRMPRIEISSSELRNRVSRQQSIRYQVPRSVEAYIESQKLYR